MSTTPINNAQNIISGQGLKFNEYIFQDTKNKITEIFSQSKTNDTLNILNEDGSFINNYDSLLNTLKNQNNDELVEKKS